MTRWLKNYVVKRPEDWTVNRWRPWADWRLSGLQMMTLSGLKTRHFINNVSLTYFNFLKIIKQYIDKSCNENIDAHVPYSFVRNTK